MKVLSLFDGISCGRVALERANIPVERYVAYEIDKHAIQISQNNYPDIEHHGDVTTANFSEYAGFDMVIGGSPCTYWSASRVAGRETTSQGLGYDLFMQFSRAISEIRPRYFLYENNYSISADIKQAISDELGVKPIMINSALVSGQQRKRMYWTNIPNITQPDDKYIMLSDVLEPDRVWKPVGYWVYQMWGDMLKIDRLYKLTNNKSATLTTKKTHPQNYYLNEDKSQYTNLTVTEFERLQTLPDGYTKGVADSHRYKAIGNGWTVDVIAHILKNLF